MLLNTPVWDDGLWPGLPSLDADLTADVCVVGLGGAGLTCVGELLAMGMRVVGIDGDTATGAASAVGRSGGFLLAGAADFHHNAVEALGRANASQIHRMSEEEIHRIAEQTPGTARFTGSLRIAASQEEMIDCARQREAMREDGIAVQNYEGPMGRGLFIPGNASVNPVERWRTIAGRAVEDGALLFVQSRALSLSANEVVTPRGRVRCDRVIVAVDGRLDSLVPELGHDVRTARLQMLATAPTREIEVPCPVLSRYGFDFWQQLPDGSIALGGGRDQAMDDEWAASVKPTQVIQDYLDHLLRDRLRVTTAVTHRWAANVSYTTTGLPLLAEVRPGVWVIGGFSSMGSVMGALCGRAVAHRACAEASEFATLLHNSASLRTH